MELEKICLEVQGLTIRAEEFISNERKCFLSKGIDTKGKNDFVTSVDKGVEKILVEGLEQIIPESGFITEEGTSLKKSDKYNWVIDPLDGTTNFIHGAPPYAISIALMHGDEIVLGVIYELTLRECFYSYKGGAAYLNGEIIRVSTAEKVKDTLIATGFPYYEYGRLEPFMKTLDYFFHHSHGVRRLGSAATDLAYVACGRYDAFYEFNLNAWDVAAGAFLVKQAGGKVSDFSGRNNYIFGKEIVASNSSVFNEFQEIIDQYMNS